MRNIIRAVIGVFLAGAIVFVVALFFPDRNEVSAQATTPPRPAIPAPRPAPQPQAQPQPQPQPQAQPAPAAAPAGPVRTESITYDMWTVTCRDTPDGKTKKVCSATLTMQAEQQNQRVTVGNWVIARNNEGALVSVLQTPQIDAGVLVNKGVELKLGDGKPRKINIVACNPRLCEASMPMDDGSIKEAIAAANGTAALTFWKGDGAAFTLSLASIKGIDKAIAAVR